MFRISIIRNPLKYIRSKSFQLLQDTKISIQNQLFLNTSNEQSGMKKISFIIVSRGIQHFRTNLTECKIYALKPMTLLKDIKEDLNK
jgi:hypothetical protein